jgi:uncharacterized protein
VSSAAPVDAVTLVYFDSSAFVKLLVEEEGSQLAATLWDDCDAVISSRLAYPEVRAALAAARRASRLTSRAHGVAEAHWEEFWSATRAVEFGAEISRGAGELAAVHSLRGADAVHLASALAFQESELLVAVWDRRLQRGVQAVGLRVVPDRL